MHGIIASFVIFLFVFAGMVALAPQGICAELLEDAVGIWLLDEKSGTDVHDSSGNGNNGKMSGGCGKWVTGKFGNALELNGTSEFVQIPDAPSLDLEQEVTMVNWFWWEGSGDGWQTFFSKGPMSGTNENWAHFINTVWTLHPFHSERRRSQN